MRHAQTIHRVAEVALLLIKVLGGNWSAIFSLALGMMELYISWRGRETGVASAV